MLSSDYDRKIYAKLYNSIEKYQSEIKFEPETSTARIHHIFLRVLADNPILFWVKKDIEFVNSSDFLIANLFFIFPKEKIIDIKHKITREINKIYDICTPDCTSDYELELAVHDYLTQTIEYVNDGCAEQQTMVGPILNKKGVCEGIAFAFSYIMGVFGIRCTTVYGRIQNEQDGHAWNIIFLEGKGYHVDVTHDLANDTYPGCHANFNLKDSDYVNRVWDSEIKCYSSNYNYFRYNKLKCNSDWKILSCLHKAIESLSTTMEIQINEDLDLEDVLTLIDNESVKLNITCRYWWISDRHCLFTKIHYNSSSS